MIILGVTDSHDCGAALIRDGEIVAAVNEERLVREKLCWGFPHRAIEEVLRIANVEKKDVDYIAIATRTQRFTEQTLSLKDGLLIDEGDRKFMASLSKFASPFLKTDAWLQVHKAIGVPRYWNRRSKLGEMFKRLGFDAKLMILDHHLCHAASAYFTCGQKEALVVTSDDAGDALSGSVYHGKDGILTRLHENSTFNSIGTYYGYVTRLCGFKILRHEGKITGLAAFGKPKYKPLFDRMISAENGHMVNHAGLRHEAALEMIKREIGENFSKEDLAASIQQHLEDQMTKLVSFWQDKTGLSFLALAGGTFANVKLNQRLLQMREGNRVFVHPHMGDGGLATGAGLYAFSVLKGLKPFRMKDAYLGPSFSDAQILAAIEKYGLKAHESSDVEGEIVSAMREKKVVAHFNGRMEYGPRALGNRSIIADPTDAKINQWLNDRLRRSEFMPFAPSAMKDKSAELFSGYGAAEYPSEFMTITLDVEKDWQPKLQGVTHVDGTARPQGVTASSNADYYSILRTFYRETGLPTFINTSFNMHEEPIVCTPEDAIRGFLDGALDMLVMDKFILLPRKG